MVDIRIVSVGFERNKSFLDALTQNHDTELNILLHEIAENIITDAKYILAANGNVNSAQLINSLEILDEGNKTIRVGTNVPYAGYVEFGRGPVRPVNATVLHWIDPRTGKSVFSKYAGPTEPSPFLQPAVEKNTKIFQGLYTEMIETRFL